MDLLLRLLGQLAQPGASGSAAAGGGLASETIAAALAPLYEELATMRQYLSRSLFRRLLSSCWAATTGAVDKLVLAQTSRHKPLRPEEVGVLERALEVLLGDFSADGSGLTDALLRASSARTQRALYLATQPTGDVVAAFLELMEELYRSCEAAGRHIAPASRPTSMAGMAESADSYAPGAIHGGGSSSGRRLRESRSTRCEGEPASPASSCGSSAKSRDGGHQQQQQQQQQAQGPGAPQAPGQEPRSTQDTVVVHRSSSDSSVSELDAASPLHPARLRQAAQPAFDDDDEEHSPVSRATHAQSAARLACEAAKRLTCLDILRLLRQRRGDIEAVTFMAVQLGKASELVPQILFGLAPEEKAVVMASCQSSSQPAPQQQQGVLYLCSRHLAFSTVLGAAGQRALEELHRPASRLSQWMAGMKGSKGRERALLAASLEPFVPDFSLLLPLEQIVRLDKVFLREREALMVTLADKTSHTFQNFDEGVRDAFVDHVRLHVMGTESPLDRNLRGRAATPAAHSLQLPPGAPRPCPSPCPSPCPRPPPAGPCPAACTGRTRAPPPPLPPRRSHRPAPAPRRRAAGESVLRSYPCRKYGTLKDRKGNLFICTSQLVFDEDGERLALRYADVAHLKLRQGRSGLFWAAVQMAGGTKYEFGGEEQQMAQDIIEEIRSLRGDFGPGAQC